MNTTYSVRTTPDFDKQIKKLDSFISKKILMWLYKNIENTEDPRTKGKGLSKSNRGLWRYRIGDYRVICSIEDDQLIVLALEVGHRSKVYD